MARQKEASMTGKNRIEELQNTQLELADNLGQADRLLTAQKQEITTLEDRLVHIEKDVVESLETDIHKLASMIVAERKEAETHTRKLVAVAEERIRQQLAYRFGVAVVRALKNPLRLLVLPVELVRQRLMFQKADKPILAPRSPKKANPLAAIGFRPYRDTNLQERHSETKEERSAEDAAKIEPSPVMVSIATAQSMTLDALAKLPKANLHLLSKQALRDGALRMQMRLAELRWKENRNTANANHLRFVRSKLTELDVRWLPPLKKSRSFDPDPKVILHIFKVFYPQESSGGAVRNWSIFRSQAAVGYRPVAVLPAGAVDQNLLDGVRPNHGMVGVAEGDGTVYYCNLPALNPKKIPLDTLLGFEASLIESVAAAERPSIVHAASGFRGYETALKGLAVARAHKLPLVYEVRSFHEHVWGPIREDILDLEQTVMRSNQEIRCMSEAEAVVTISRAMARELGRRGIDEDKIFVVPNSVEDRFFEEPDEAAVAAFRQRWQLDDAHVIGYISNLSGREGHNVLIDGFHRIARERPNTKLLIVGDGPMRDAIVADIRERGLADRVVVTGAIDHRDIISAYAAIDLFVVPRIEDYASDFVTPMKPFESMALGCSLIMSDRPVTEEVLGQDRGLTFETGSGPDLARAMLDCIDHPDSARDRAETARKWLAENRRWPSVITRYDDIYAYARANKAKRTEAAAHG